MVSRIPSYLIDAALTQKRIDASENRVRGKTWVYMVHWQTRGPTKIGVADDPRTRKAMLQSGNPYKLEIFTAFGLATTALALEIEQAALKRLASCRLIGEWLDATPGQVRDIAQECITKRGLRPLIWQAEIEQRPNPNRARLAMAEYRRLHD